MTMTTTAEEQRHDMDLAQLHDALLRLRNGDFSARLPADWKYRGGMVARVFNSLAEMLETLSQEFIRVADETGKQGYLGGQAEVFGISGRWREMYDSLNHMAEVLTMEVRRTSQTAKAWADGDASTRMDPGLIPGEFVEMQQRLNAAADRWTGAPSK